MICPNESIKMQQIKVESNYGQTVILDQCPKCGSWNIQRLSMYLAEQKAQKTGSGCGTGCLIALVVLILFLIAPGYCLCTAVGAGAGAGALIANYWYLIVIGILIAVAVSIGQYFYFICKSCGHKFIKKSKKTD